MPVTDEARHRRVLMLALALLPLALSPAPAWSQDPRPNLLVRQKQHNTGHRDQEPLFRADVNLVLVPVAVTDLTGRFVNGLRRENFRV
ncbi:MAG: hypothetical protein HY236_09510, partial [Acidobacteria bacterium]|nr:hypothetical protein [Acidobacteriota bacterium]